MRICSILAGFPRHEEVSYARRAELRNRCVRCYESVTLFDNPLGGPLESLDAVRNSATMKGVIGWSSQL